MASFNFSNFSAFPLVRRLIRPVVETTSLDFDFEQAEQARKVNLLKAIDLLLASTAGLTGVGCLLLSLFFNEPLVFLVLSATCGIACCIYLFALWLVHVKGLYYRAAWLTLITLASAITLLYFLTGTKLPFTFIYLIPLALTLVLFNQKTPALVTLLMAFGATFCLYILQDFAKIYTPIVKITPDTEAVLDLMVLVIGTILAALLIYLPQVSQLRTLQTRTRGLQRTLQELNLKQITGQEVSQEVLSLASQLTSVATQQAAGSQTQVATVTQVNSSVQELSTAASQITQIVHRVEKATNSMTEGSHLIESTTINSVEQAREGLQAVSQTLVASQQVAELYRQLLVKTEQLAERSDQMRQILQLLDGISAETHLLSLNAAIEAAGAGQFGDRFGVVAGEVKNLSDRSRKAGQKVAEIVEEISNYSLELRQVAQAGSSSASELETVAHQTGQRIEQLQTVAYQAQAQASSITKKAEEVENLTQIIHVSTAQQSSASEQVLASLNELLEVARQGANGSVIVVNTARFLENLSDNLNKTLVLNQVSNSLSQPNAEI